MLLISLLLSIKKLVQVIFINRDRMSGIDLESESPPFQGRLWTTKVIRIHVFKEFIPPSTRWSIPFPSRVGEVRREWCEEQVFPWAVIDLCNRQKALSHFQAEASCCLLTVRPANSLGMGCRPTKTGRNHQAFPKTLPENDEKEKGEETERISFGGNTTYTPTKTSLPPDIG